MKFQKLLIHFFKRLKSILILCVTISLLFYYTFQNEIDILNSYAENEYLPSINVHTPVTNTDHNNLIPNNELRIPDESNNDNLNDLKTKVDLNKKNKYFPLLIPSPDMDPSLSYHSDDSTSSHPLIYKEKYPVLYQKSLPIDTSGDLGPQFPQFKSDRDDNMINKIHDIMVKSWEQQTPQWMNDPWPIDLIDSLDTLYLMNETKRFQTVLDLLSNIDFKVPYTVNQMIDIPDVVSRGLGGFLSAYELSGEDILLVKAKQLGDFILRAFDTPNRLPVVSYPWRSLYNNRYPYKETNLGSMMKMTVEMTKLSQLSTDDKYFDAIYHTLQYLWQTSSELPVKSLFPNIVDASGCKLLSNHELSVGKHQKDQMMKSINEDLNFVYCHQLGHFANFSTKISVDDKDYFSIYDSLSKLYSITNVDILHSMQPSLDSITSTSKKSEEMDASPDHLVVQDSDITKRGLSSVHKMKIIDSKVIFHEAMEHILKLMSFKPSAPMNLTVISDLDTNALYRPATNELEVQLRRDFKFQPESCQLAATLIYGKNIFTSDEPEDDSSLQMATELIESCFKLTKHQAGLISQMSLDWGSDYNQTASEDIIFTEEGEIPIPNNLPYNENNKLENVLVGKYLGFEKGFPMQNEVFASKVKQSNLINEEWKRSYSYLNNEQFMNVKLTSMDIDMEKRSWNPDHHEHSELPLWINGIDNSRQTILSPYLIKSILYLHRTTGDSKWRKMGEELFEISIDRIKSMNMGPKGMWKISESGQENIPSYWFSQTLKYYYLLFEQSSKFSFNEYIYTNNGHLLSRSKSVTANSKVASKKRLV
ncbi:putative endoplasmic reticulum mannosidase Mnl2p [Monosporozyma servazzii]